MMKLADNWAIDGKLPVQAMLISLQGLANTGGPRLYFVYPEKWDFLFTPSVLEFYKNKHHYSFTELTTPESALSTFRQYVKGYVVWDKNVRTSLIVAFTIAGLEKAVVVSEDLIPMAEAAGLKPVMDLRGTFTGQSDVQIYQWAYDRYWDRCSREFVVWMGGESGKIMKPGVADFGILKQAFFTDLSTEPADSAEYVFARKIMSGAETDVHGDGMAFLCQGQGTRPCAPRIQLRAARGWPAHAAEYELQQSDDGHSGIRFQEQPSRETRGHIHSGQEGLHHLRPDRLSGPRCMAEAGAR